MPPPIGARAHEELTRGSRSFADAERQRDSDQLVAEYGRRVPIQKRCTRSIFFERGQVDGAPM